MALVDWLNITIIRKAYPPEKNGYETPGVAIRPLNDSGTSSDGEVSLISIEIQNLIITIQS